MAGCWALPRLRADTGTRIAAVFPPWWSEEDIFTAAANSGAEIVGAAGVPGVMVVRAVSGDTLAALYRSGVLSLIRTDAAAGCSALSRIF